VYRHRVLAVFATFLGYIMLAAVSSGQTCPGDCPSGCTSPCGGGCLSSCDEDPDCPSSPIVIDVSGHGFSLTSVEQGVDFDFSVLAIKFVSRGRIADLTMPGLSWTETTTVSSITRQKCLAIFHPSRNHRHPMGSWPSPSLIDLRTVATGMEWSMRRTRFIRSFVFGLTRITTACPNPTNCFPFLSSMSFQFRSTTPHPNGWTSSEIVSGSGRPSLAPSTRMSTGSSTTFF
jgi:hypothetical protein